MRKNLSLIKMIFAKLALILIVLAITEAQDIFDQKVYIKSFHGTFLRADIDKTTVNLIDHSQEWEEWTIHQLPDNKVFLQSYWDTFLRALDNGGIDQAKEQSTWEAWTLETLDNGKYAFVSVWGTYLSASDKGFPNQASWEREWEEWEVIPK